MNPLGIVGIIAASFALLANILGFALGFGGKYFIIFNLVFIFLTISGLILWFFVIKDKIGKQEEEPITHDRMSQEVKKYIMNEASVGIGHTMEKGVRKLGMEGEKKVSVFYWFFRDADSSDEYIVGISMQDLNIRNWARNPDKIQMREMLMDLADTRAQAITTVREVVDPISGRTSKETTSQPFYMQKEQPVRDDEEGDL